METLIEIENLTKKFNDHCIIENLSLKFEEGKIYSILAPSGAGKTTLLRLIAGLDSQFDGSIKLNFKGAAKNIGLIFQESSIFPWLTVKENILFGLNLKANNAKTASTSNYESIITDLKLEKFTKYYPKQLSGGQKQRVIFGRSLMLQPKILLCDEPFSSLDESTRQEMRELLLSIHKHYEPTIIFVTHSVEEAVFLGDTIIVFSSSPIRTIQTLNVAFNSKRNKLLLTNNDFVTAKAKIFQDGN